MKNHVGNYYNWSATVASNDTSGSTTQYDDMTDSICPAGWRLPTSRQSNDSALEGNELGTLIYSYDIAGELQSCGGTCTYANYLDGGFNTIRAAPLWSARSGRVNGGSLNNTGSSGYYWSSTVGNSSNVFYLSFDSGGAAPTYNFGRGYGYSVRCLAE